MLKIIDGDIHLTRGDTAELTLTIMVNDEEEYTLGNDDVCVLTVKKNTQATTNVLQATLGEDNKFTISPADTSNLTYGKYKYDVQLTTGENNVYTIVAPHDFVIEQEVTF